jgi:hypothetical protein
MMVAPVGCALMACAPVAKPQEDRAPRAQVPVVVDTTAIEAAVTNKAATPVEAVLNLAAALSKQGRNAAYLQQLTTVAQQRLSAQVIVLARERDPETAARAANVLAFMDAFSRFLADQVASESADAEAIVAWGLEPGNVPLVAASYHRGETERSGASGALAQSGSKYADVLLARLIDDGDREVSIRAMDAAYDREPSEVLVDALLKKAILNTLRNSGISIEKATGPRNPAQGKQLQIRGRSFHINDAYIEFNRRAADGEVAVDVLLHYKSDLVKQRVGVLFEKIIAQGGANAVRYLSSPNYGSTAVHATRIIQQYRPASLYAVLVGSLLAPSSGGNTQTINGQECYISARTEMIGYLVQLAELDPEHYNLTQMRNWGYGWMIKGGVKEEEKAAADLVAWWKVHYKEFGATTPEVKVPSDLGQGGRYYGRGRWRG